MIPSKGYGTKSKSSQLELITFERKDPKENEIVVEVMYCGVCHSDRHQVLNEWKNTIYPCIPGHEIVGKVQKTGGIVTKFKVGDIVGVGTIINSCRECDPCQKGLEQYCEQGALGTYNGYMNNSDGQTNTFGGYSNLIVVPEDFVLRIPKNLDLAAAAPLLCAGVTTYSPLRHWNVGKGDKVGIIGVGGLGHIAAKIANALGAEVTLISTTQIKSEDLEKLGAKDFIHSTNEDQMKLNAKKFNYLLSTIPETHDAMPYVSLLALDGVFTIVGCLMPLSKPLNMQDLILSRRSLAGSVVGGIQETQEVLDFFAEHNIQPDIELIKMDYINEAFKRIKKADVRYRFVIDMSSLK